MNKSSFLVLAIAIGIWASACDEIDPPVYGCTDPIADNYNPQATHNDGTCTYDPNLFRGCKDTAAINYDPLAIVDDCHCRYANVRKILVEDYTGHTCGNCPRAAEILHSLECEWGDRVVPLAVHVGFFSLPQNLPDGKYANDYRTPFGNDWNTYFGNSAAGLPNGLVNRIPDGGNYIRSYTAWSALAANLLAQPAEATISLTNTYSEGTRTVSVVADINVLTNLSNGPYKLFVVVSEDSVVNWQKDYSLDDEDIPDYKHMHMLRTSLTGTWGADVNGGANLPSGQALTLNFSVQLNEEWNAHHCNIVAWLAQDGNKQVIQAEYRPVIE